MIFVLIFCYSKIIFFIIFNGDSYVFKFKSVFFLTAVKNVFHAIFLLCFLSSLVRSSSVINFVLYTVILSVPKPWHNI